MSTVQPKRRHPLAAAHLAKVQAKKQEKKQQQQHAKKRKEEESSSDSESESSSSSSSSDSSHDGVDAPILPGDVLLPDIPSRSQWGQAEGQRGYCGECTVQMHALYSGNWISQELARKLADDHELLLAKNAHLSCQAMKFPCEEFDWKREKKPQIKKFCEFIKRHLDAGHLIAGGFGIDGGDQSDYDHIMPIIGYRPAKSGSKYAIGGIFFYDNYEPERLFISIPEATDTRGKMPGGGNQKKGGSSSSSSSSSEEDDDDDDSDSDDSDSDSDDDDDDDDDMYFLWREECYGLAMMGVEDTAHETFPMTLVAPQWDEPDWGKEDKYNMPPIDLTFSAHIHGLQAGHRYAVVRFDDHKTLPSCHFLTDAHQTAKFEFTAAGADHVLYNFDHAMSNKSAFYRCVAVPA